MHDKAVTFERINNGGQVFLSDGTVWRVATKFFETSRSWKQGERIRVSGSQSPTHPNLLINEDRSELALVVLSSGCI